MTHLEKLFEPIRVGQIELKNRIVMLAMGTYYGTGYDITDRVKSFYEERAKGGVGLMISLSMSPSPGGDLGPGAGLYIHDDRFIPSLSEFTELVHNHGAKVAAQIVISYTWARNGNIPAEAVAPSEVVTGPGIPPFRALTIEEIQQIVDEFGVATGRAREAGFDAVEFHAGIGYLINRFLSPCANKREDQYGGSLENRLRFLLEIIESAKKNAGDDYTLMCRISAEEFMKGGHTIDDTRQFAPLLEKAGIHALDVQAGWHESPLPLIQASVAPGAYVYLADEVRKVVNIPVIAAYRINDPMLAEQILAEGKADLIGMGRPLIADPDLPNKAKEGKFSEIRPCIACCNCLDCLRETPTQPVVCSVNSRAGREKEYSILRTEKPRKVFIIGGGPAGMEAARVAAQVGHEVTLWESDGKLGGQLILASVPPYKDDIEKLRQHLVSQIEQAGVRVEFEEATKSYIESGKPDAVIVATGATSLIPNITGVGKGNVVNALDVLAGRREVRERVVIVGGGMIGCETAEFLASKGNKVTILEMLGHMGSDIGKTTRWVVLRRLKEAGIKMEARVIAEEITDDGVKVNQDGTSKFYECDTVVLAVGLDTNRKLAQELEGKVPNICLVGDCVAPRRITQSIEEGFRAGLRIAP
ncbi:FAD-dependent oxidoreductase [Chloroflexota bacterium]